jgi:hypothetical protein
MSIIPNPLRWQASVDPTSIDVPGLDTNASVNDQIDQIEQLITIKLQVVLIMCLLPLNIDKVVRTSTRISQRFRISWLQSCYQP